MTSPFIEHFSNLSDPRVTGRTDYPLLEIVFLCISAVVSGFDGWESIEDFGHSKLEWLRQFLDYKNGIPKHDTIARVISCLSATGLQRCFIDWVQDIANCHQLGHRRMEGCECHLGPTCHSGPSGEWGRIWLATRAAQQQPKH